MEGEPVNVVVMSADSVRARVAEVGNEVLLVVEDGATRVELVGHPEHSAALGCQRVQTAAGECAEVLLQRAAGINAAVVGHPGHPDEG